MDTSIKIANGKIRIKRGMSPKLKALIKMLNKLKPIEPEFGVWYDTTEYKPARNGRYLVILQSTSPVRDCQIWAGMGEPETASYNENYDTSPIVNWNARGSLSVAYFTAMPVFNMQWEKGFFNEPGKWVDKTVENAH